MSVHLQLVTSRGQLCMTPMFSFLVIQRIGILFKRKFLLQMLIRLKSMEVPTDLCCTWEKIPLGGFLASCCIRLKLENIHECMYHISFNFLTVPSIYQIYSVLVMSFQSRNINKLFAACRFDGLVIKIYCLSSCQSACPPLGL